MATITVHVKNGQFNQSSNTGSDGDTVQFINDRSANVPVHLSGFDKSKVDLGTSSNDKSQSATINISSGKATFTAPKVQSESPKQGDGDIKGDITVNPKK